MINLSDFEPLSIAKIKKFSSTIGFLLKIFSDKVHAILIEEVTVQTILFYFTRHLVCLFYWANLPRGKEHEQDSGPMRGAPPYPTQKDQRDRPQHRELRALLFSMSV